MYRLIFIPIVFSILQTCSSVEVREDQVGLLWESSAGKLTPLKKGRYMLWGMYDTVYLYSTRKETRHETVVVTTQDDLQVEVQASIIYGANGNEITALHLEFGEKYYEKIVREDFRASIKNVLARYKMIQIPKKSAELEQEILETLAARIKNRHVLIEDVNIDETKLDPGIMNAIAEKLKREQELETMKYNQKIAEKEDEIAKMKAKRDAEVEIIAAEAKAKTQKLTNVHITPAYLKLKTVEASMKALESPNSKLIFVPVGKDGLPLNVNISDKIFSETGFPALPAEKKH